MHKMQILTSQNTFWLESFSQRKFLFSSYFDFKIANSCVLLVGQPYKAQLQPYKAQLQPTILFNITLKVQSYPDILKQRQE
jgi:hypothetical protein